MADTFVVCPPSTRLDRDMQFAMHQPAAAENGVIERFFAETAMGFDRAADSRGATTHDFLVAGRQVRIRIAGDALSHLTRPLAHLISGSASRPSESAGLEILAWDSPDGWLPPRPPWDFQRLGHGGAIAGLESERVLVNFSADHGLLCLYHRPSNRAVYWLPTAERLPYWEIAAPFRILLHWFSQSFGAQIVHAAAVGRDGQGVLLAGRGGSGKSTTAITCLDAGMQYGGDDYVLLMPGPTPIAHSLYHSTKIHTAFLNRALPHWRARVAARIGPEQKSLLFVNECLTDQVRERLQIRAVLQPKVGTASGSQIRPQSASLGLLAIAPSTMYQLPQARQTTLSVIADCLRDIPSFRLELGSDLSSAPNELTKLLGEKEASRAA